MTYQYDIPGIWYQVHRLVEACAAERNAGKTRTARSTAHERRPESRKLFRPNNLTRSISIELTSTPCIHLYNDIYRLCTRYWLMVVGIIRAQAIRIVCTYSLAPLNTKSQ